jgi:hypothetical protein
VALLVVVISGQERVLIVDTADARCVDAGIGKSVETICRIVRSHPAHDANGLRPQAHTDGGVERISAALPVM